MSQVRDKAIPAHTKMTYGKMELLLHSFRTLALNGCGESQTPERLTLPGIKSQWSFIQFFANNYNYTVLVTDK